MQERMQQREVSYVQRVAQLHQELQVPAEYPARGLSFHVEPEQVIIGDYSCDAREILMEPETAHYWKKMKEAAATFNITLLAESGYRSIERQAELIRKQLMQGRSLEDILKRLAAPGYSEHHTGRALDISSPECLPALLVEQFELTRAFAWLEEHAATFGFFMSYPRHNAQGIIFEPWHWCFDPERIDGRPDL